MIKRTDVAKVWAMYDSARSDANVVQRRLQAESSAAEYDNSVVAIDFLSNGFKIRTTDSDTNTNGGTYIYAAFAESPFQYARAR